MRRGCVGGLFRSSQWGLVEFVGQLKAGCSRLGLGKCKENFDVSGVMVIASDILKQASMLEACVTTRREAQ